VRITLLCVGRAKSAPEQEICEFYLKRAGSAGKALGFPAIDLAVVETSRGPEPRARMEEEAARIAKRIPSGAHRIALDERGVSFTSPDFAARLAALRDSGLRDLVFVVGGPDGLATALRDAADERFALGPQTWPHLLVRAMMAEQIYRALSILAGHPYHRGG
jgi:23S rRNA (pseudouridine1915-N3)-methyltransferase